MKRSLKRIAAWWQEYWAITDLLNGDDSWHGAVRGFCTIITGFIIIVGFVFAVSYFKIPATSIVILIGFPLMFVGVGLIFLGAWHFVFSLAMLFENLSIKEKRGQ